MRQDQAWKYYKQWSKEKTYCPAFGQNVHITRKGWDHLSAGSSSRRRKSRDRARRLGLLKLARYTISHAETYEVVRKEHGVFYVISLRPPKHKQLVRVVLKKDKQGKYYFFSVM